MGLLTLKDRQGVHGHHHAGGGVAELRLELGEFLAVHLAAHGPQLGSPCEEGLGRGAGPLGDDLEGHPGIDGAEVLGPELHQGVHGIRAHDLQGALKGLRQGQVARERPVDPGRRGLNQERGFHGLGCLCRWLGSPLHIQVRPIAPGQRKGHSNDRDGFSEHDVLRSPSGEGIDVNGWRRWSNIPGHPILKEIIPVTIPTPINQPFRTHQNHTNATASWLGKPF